jgi:hypothetical protein
VINGGDARRALLEQLDDAEHAEAPPNWDRQAAEARFVALAPALEQRLGYPCPYETGALIQDASFHGEISLPHDILTKNDGVTLRTSNFGRMAAIYGDETVVRPEALATVVATLEEHGYTYVPSAVLMAPYTGKDPGVEGFTTWMDRFFDWV